MPIFIALLIVLGLAVIFGPQLWAQFILKRHSKDRSEIPGTGGELAIHLVENTKLDGVKVEKIPQGDHYDPVEKAIRLSEAVYDGKSLTAVVVAAHEVGHAIQDRLGYVPLKLRTRLIGLVALSERVGAIILVALPFITALTRIPATGAAMLIIGLAILLVPVVVHLITLPVEFDASFKRALPILALGYVPDEEMPAARRILTACALTYVAASLSAILNFWRWIYFLRR
ncbi:MAG TPA: peptidase [Gammaproteobacteria bacterium]|nr:peptidase [Gammaproteobacteria bacterium]|tara:strand:- start:72 stop:758 length:687 start_codon:yes stop_codon:yes gene_type:complete